MSLAFGVSIDTQREKQQLCAEPCTKANTINTGKELAVEKPTEAAAASSRAAARVSRGPNLQRQRVMQ